MGNSAELQFTDAEIQHMLNNIDQFSAEEITEIFKMVDELEERQFVAKCHDDLIEFTLHMMPNYIIGTHHRILSGKLSEIEQGVLTRLCVNIAPRHGKSQLVSTMYPAWFLGRNPSAKVMLVSHTADLAVDFGRKVRDLIDSDEYQRIFPGVRLSKDNKSAGRWTTTAGGEAFCCGIGAKLAGRGADLLLIDDPHSEQDVLNGNFEVFEKAYAWFAYGARTRLMPGGRVAIIQCMTGDTPVRLSDGSEKPLSAIRPGDEVATWDNGELSTARVLNHTSNGLDNVFTIRTTSHTVKANERHPFLVQRDNGDVEWVRVKNLRVGDSLVSLKDANAPVELKPNRASAEHVNQKTLGIENTLTLHTALWGTTVNIREKLAFWMGVANLLPQRVCVQSTITKRIGKKVGGDLPHNRPATDTLNTGTESRWKSIIRCWASKVVSALSVKNPLQAKTLEHIGMGSCVLTTAMTQATSEPYCATTVTSPSDIQKHDELHSQSLNTSRFTLTKITSIEASGVEEVFDVQIDRTENFIANGLVSHNTRWHMDDLTGRVVRDMAMNPDTDQYEVIEFPAILHEGEDEEKALWPEFFDLKALKQIKAGMPTFQWNAQYQQNPTGETAAVVKREWWKYWTKETPPDCEYIIMSLDSAAETNNRADYTALTTWGVFLNEHEDRYEIILLNSVKKRFEFPELKDAAYEHYNEWEPDCFIVEKKSSGVALYQEMRRMGLPVQEYTPHRGTGDKLARLNSVADIIRSGMVWVPQTRWAEELVEEVASFPFASNDDLVDSTVMALMRFRNGGFVRLPTDEPEEPKYFKQRRGGYY